MTSQQSIQLQAQNAKGAARLLVSMSAAAKSKILLAMADAVEKNTSAILSANQLDVEAAKKNGVSSSFIDRLTLSDKSIQAMARSVREIAAQPDPLGEVLESLKRPNGIQIDKVRVPLGVIGIIYESRPNVTVDASVLCLKAGNAVILRGGKDAFRSNQILAKLLQEAGRAAGLPDGAVQLLESVDRASITELTQFPQYVDLIIARGSEEMINDVMKNSLVPVLGHGKGVCHVYVDEAADETMAEQIAYNAKVQRPGVCNSMETLLVHTKKAAEFLPAIGKKYQQAGVEIRGDAETQKLLPYAKPATEADWSTEYVALIVSVRVVPSLDDAIRHINQYGSGHSDAIVTQDGAHAQQFLNQVDSAAVFHNASTRLHDGGVFGLGAEMGISTRKLHARGTMGARELTTTKYVIHGTGQIRE